MLGYSPILVILVKVTEIVQHNNGFTNATEHSCNSGSATASRVKRCCGNCTCSQQHMKAQSVEVS